MHGKVKNSWDGCPIRYGMGMFGDKWTLLLIRDLMFKGKVYYGEFGDECENIASNILADRLARLQQNGIVDKHRDRSNRTRFRYTLTHKGIDLLPVMLAIVEWSQKYDEHSEVPAEFSRRLSQDRKRLTKEIIEALPRPEPAPVG